MAQTQTAALKRQDDGDVVDYTPAAAMYAGDVVVLGDIPLIAEGDVGASELGCLITEGVFDIPKSSDVFVVGHPVYWTAAGTPVTGTASTGAATNASGRVMGICLSNANAAVSYVRTKLRGLSASAFTGVQTVVATGTVIGNAASTGYGITIVSGSDNAAGIQLPSCVPGACCVIINQVTDKTMKIWPPTGKQINGAGANNAVVVAVNSVDVLYSEGTNAWRGFTASIDLA